MSIQLDLPLSESKLRPVVNVRFGDTFVRNNEILMRVKPVNWILNSSLVVDVINTNRVFVVNILKGTLFIIPGSDMVKPVKMQARLTGV